MAFNLDNYETVEVRLNRFWEKYPNARVQTDVLEKNENSILIRAAIFAERNDMNPMATGIAEEIKTQSGVNRDAWVENCETSAIGRALANANFASGKRPSREEMEKVQRREVAQQNISAEQLADAHNVKEAIDVAESIDELKLIHDGAKEANLLQVPVAGTTVIRAISEKKKALEKQIEK